MCVCVCVLVPPDVRLWGKGCVHDFFGAVNRHETNVAEGSQDQQDAPSRSHFFLQVSASDDPTAGSSSLVGNLCGSQAVAGLPLHPCPCPSAGGAAAACLCCSLKPQIV